MSKLSRVLPQELVGPCFRLCDDPGDLALESSESCDEFAEPNRRAHGASRRSGKGRRQALGESLSTRCSCGAGARN